MINWKTVPTKMTPEMRKAAATAAREYMKETGGNNLDVIWAAALAAAPAPQIRHELEIVVTDRNNTYRARATSTQAAEAAGLKGLNATCTAGSVQAVRELLKKATKPLDIEHASIVAMLPEAGDRYGVSRFSVHVEDRSCHEG